MWVIARIKAVFLARGTHSGTFTWSPEEVLRPVLGSHSMDRGPVVLCTERFQLEHQTDGPRVAAGVWVGKGSEPYSGMART